jgi:hypothetical protein
MLPEVTARLVQPTASADHAPYEFALGTFARYCALPSFCKHDFVLVFTWAYSGQICTSADVCTRYAAWQYAF